MKRAIASLALAASCALAFAPREARAEAASGPRFFHDLYGDVTYTYRYGPATFDRYRAGLRLGPLDVFGFARYDAADTGSSQVPTQYSYGGAVVGGGSRVWLFGRTFWLGVDVGRGVSGTRAEITDVRAGGAGFWDDDDLYAKVRRETYVEAFYIDDFHVVNDGFLLARHRHGLLLDELGGGWAWAYGVAQLNLSAKGDYGADNRAELGLGTGWRRFWSWHDSPLMPDTVFGLTLNAEARVGTIVRGDLGGMSRTYVTPLLVLAGGF